MSAETEKFDYTKSKPGENMAKQPVKGDAAGDALAAPAKSRVNPYFPKAANQAGMSIALLATMVLNIPIFQRAADQDQMAMVIFEVVLMFLCTASCGILAMSCTQNFARGITEELRRQLPKQDSEG